MDVPQPKQGGMSRPIFAGGIALAVAVPCAIMAMATGNYFVAVPILLSPLGFVRYFQKAQEDWQRKFEEAWALEPELEANELPTHAYSSGIVLKDVLQAPGRVEYESGTFTIFPTLGKETTVSLDDVSDFEISPCFNGSMMPGRYSVELKVSRMWRLGFTITKLEPWRSILTHHIESRKQSSIYDIH